MSRAVHGMDTGAHAYDKERMPVRGRKTGRRGGLRRGNENKTDRNKRDGDEAH